MKRVFIIIACLVLSQAFSFGQDVRTVETRVADLLARMPAYNESALTRQMEAMKSLPENGWDMIFNQLVPPGSGDDTGIRFAIESYSRYTSSFGRDDSRRIWELYLISQAGSITDHNIKRFIISQLLIVGREPSGEFALRLLKTGSMASEALAVIEATAYTKAEEEIATMLAAGNSTIPVDLMNLLGKWKSDMAVDACISYYTNGDVNTRAAALRALAASGSPLALKVLATAAKEYNYGWDQTGSTSAYLAYAARLGEMGDIKGMEKICREVMKEARDANSLQYRCEALSVLAHYRSYEILPDLVQGFTDPVNEYRKHSLRIASEIPGSLTTRKYLESLATLNNVFVADVIRMISKRNDITALPHLQRLMFSADKGTRMSAAEGAVRLGGTTVAPDLITYLLSYTDLDEQEAGFALFSQIADTRRIKMLAEFYPAATELTKAFIIVTIAEGGENTYFDLILSQVSDRSDLIRNASLVSLKNVAGPSNTEQLITLLNNTTEKPELQQVQLALAVAVSGMESPDRGADRLLGAMNDDNAEKIIPVLPLVGGDKSLEKLLEYFKRGGKERVVAFDALTAWRDYRAAYALYDICASGEEGYVRPAFESYIRQVSASSIPGEQKLLLLRKLMVLASTAEQKIRVLEGISGIRTITAMNFVAAYLDDPELSSIAAQVLVSVIQPQPGAPDALYGDNVRAVLNRLLPKLGGPESDYTRESIRSYLEFMPPGPGFVAIFNGSDLDGWQGLVENPLARSKMSKADLARKQAVADREMLENWSVKDNAIWFSGNGANLCTVKEYGDFEMLVDWKITKDGDSGIYLRGTPQVQIWDTSRVEVGAQVGSGGLYNNSTHRSTPLVVADNPVGEWNSFRILMLGEKVSVWLNGVLVVDDVVMENYWDRSKPIFATGPIELQAHGNELAFRDIYVREIKSDEYGLTPTEKSEGFVSLFNGRTLDNWIGNKQAYVVEEGNIVVKPGEGSGGNLYTEKQYSNFNFRFEFKLTPGANNGLGIRAPLEGDAAYVGMELQILDNTASIYANLQPYQYHGSVYGVIPAKRGFLKPVGEWNSEEVIVDGTRVTVVLNGEVIVDGDIADARDKGTMDHNEHPGLSRTSGHIGFLGHGSEVFFRNIRIKELK